MLDKTYKKTVREGNDVLVKAKRGTKQNLLHIKLSFKRRNDYDYQISSNVNDCLGSGENYYVAFEDLQDQLLKKGYSLYCCGNCRYLQLTGLSRQMSSGTMGYCLVYVKEHGRSLNDSVSIFDYCERFEHGPQAFIKELNEKIKKRKGHS